MSEQQKITGADLLEWVDDIAAAAELAAVVVPGSREAQIAALAGRISRRAVAALQRLMESGQLTDEELTLPGLRERVDQILATR